MKLFTPDISHSNRLSNFEALRLLAMLMVLNVHSFSGYNNGEGIAQLFDFFRESTSVGAVDVFLIISGYFGIKWKFKSFYNLIFQLLFYSLVIYAFTILFGILDFNLHDLKSCLKVTYNCWGFITGYVLLYFLSPFLNDTSNNSSCSKLLSIIVILFFACNFISPDPSNYLHFMLMYLIGRFIRKTDSVSKLEFNAFKWFILFVFLLFLSSYFIYKYMNVDDGSKMVRSFWGYSLKSPIVIVKSVFLFFVFAKLKFTSNFINWCSASCLSIFLIHMHPLIKNIGYYNFTASLYRYPFLEHYGILFVFILSVFFGSILFDQLRIIISDYVYKCIMLVKDIIPSKYLEIETYLPKKLKELL